MKVAYSVPCRLLAVIAAIACLLVLLPVSSASADAVFTLKTGFVYSELIPGGLGDTLIFTAHNGDSFEMGLVDESGEQSRTLYDINGWNALFAAPDWEVTVVSDAGAYCPYASSHTDHTVCPYLDYTIIQLTYRPTGATLTNVCVPSSTPSLVPTGAIHFCLGRYAFETPETVRYNADNAKAALKNEAGLWGVYDAETGSMLTDFVYDDMSAPCGDRVKVRQGGKWGVLTLSGVDDPVYMYNSADDFSVTEEARMIKDGCWRVFDADNQPISVAFAFEGATVSYCPETHLLLATAADGTSALYDLTGQEVASFPATQTVRHLQGTCSAVENRSGDAISGIALGVASGAPTSAGSVVLPGDADLDGVVATADARLLMRYRIGAIVLSNAQIAAADINGDGQADSQDVRCLLWTLSQG